MNLLRARERMHRWLRLPEPEVTRLRRTVHLQRDSLLRSGRREARLIQLNSDAIGQIDALTRQVGGLERKVRGAEARADRAERERERMAGLTLHEPPASEHCTKVRLHTEEEAATFLLHVAEINREEPERLGAYQCKRCPRHPATMDRFWHVGHLPGIADAAREERRTALDARDERRERSGRTLGSRLDGDLRAELMKRVSGEGG